MYHQTIVVAITEISDRLLDLNIIVISFFNRQIFFRKFSFLIFYGLYDICNQCKLASDCCFGKKSSLFGN